MKHTLIIIILSLSFYALSFAQQSENLREDSAYLQLNDKAVQPEKTSRFFIPKKAAMFSAALPGLGQAYNRKYWKIPILYAGIGATAYGISWNNDWYTRYRNAYIDIRDSDPESERYLDVLPPGYVFDEQSSDWKRWFESQLEKKKDGYRRDRDLLIIVMVGVYVLNIIDANVDAHLSDFDISNDLSLNVRPTLLTDNFGTGNYNLGMSFKINF